MAATSIACAEKNDPSYQQQLDTALGFAAIEAEYGFSKAYRSGRYHIDLRAGLFLSYPQEVPAVQQPVPLGEFQLLYTLIARKREEIA